MHSGANRLGSPAHVTQVSIYTCITPDWIYLDTLHQGEVSDQVANLAHYDIHYARRSTGQAPGQN